MANKPHSAPVYPYEEAESFVVSFTRVVHRGGFKYLPRDNPVMTGAAINAIVEESGADVIRSVEPR